MGEEKKYLKPMDETEFNLNIQQAKQEEEKSAEQEWMRQMKSVIKSIELMIADKLAEGITPTILLGNAQSIDAINEFYFGGMELDWKQGVGFVFGADKLEDGVILGVYRTVDLPYGKLRVV